MNQLIAVFTTVLNMSITASYVAVGVILIRLILRKAPKIYSYALWSAVFVRLITPVTFTAAFSLFGLLHVGGQSDAGQLVYVPYQIGLMQQPEVDLGMNSLGSGDSFKWSLPGAEMTNSINPMQIVMMLASLVWALGIAVLLLYSIISYLKIMNRVRTATSVRDNIYETDRIDTPFVCGFIKPKIVVPVGLSENELQYILLHEQTHIRRRDYLIKPFAFILVIVHWFNPMMWLSFASMSKDMEMSCDECVMKSMGSDIKYNYSHSLLSLSVGRSGGLKGSPLAFGESHIKSRIKNIVRYKKPRVWVITLALAVTASFLVALTANPIQAPVEASTYTDRYNESTIRQLLDNRTLYVGNNSKVVALVDAMPLPSDIIREKVELQTSSAPYEIKIFYDLSDDSKVPEPNAVHSEYFYRHAIILFSLIDNVNRISYVIDGFTVSNDSESNSFSFDREIADKAFGKDVRQFAKNEESFTSFLHNVNQLEYKQVLQRLTTSGGFNK